MKLTPAYSTYTHGDKQVSHRWLRRVYSSRAYLENYISGTLLRERLIGFFDDIDVSGLGERDSFYGGWELGHGLGGEWEPWSEKPQGLYTKLKKGSFEPARPRTVKLTERHRLLLSRSIPRSPNSKLPLPPSPPHRRFSCLDHLIQIKIAATLHGRSVTTPFKRESILRRLNYHVGLPIDLGSDCHN